METTAKLVRAYLRVRRDAGPYLFTEHEGPTKKRMIQHLFIRYAQAVGLSGRPIYSLRRSIAVHLLDAGRVVREDGRHLGHKSIQSTRISHPLREQVFRDLERHPKIVRIA